MITWKRFASGGVELSSAGHREFSALNAMMSDGRCLEAWYQCDVKGIAPGSPNWRLGKGRRPVTQLTHEESWQAYLGLWRLWAADNKPLMQWLLKIVGPDGVLTDKFARTPVSQARAVAVLLNEMAEPTVQVAKTV